MGSGNRRRPAMRFLIPFAGMLAVATAPVRSQQADAASPLDRTVTLRLEGVPLKDALDALARQSGVRIAYSGRVVPLDRPVSVQLAAGRGWGAPRPPPPRPRGPIPPHSPRADLV